MTRKRQRYVIVPDDNVFNDSMNTTSFQLFRSMHQVIYRSSARSALSQSIPRGTSNGNAPSVQPPGRFMRTEAGRIQLLDSIDLNEATLVSMTPDQSMTLARTYPGLRIRPELTLYPLRSGAANAIQTAARPSAFRSAKILAVQCLDSLTGKPVPGADIVVVLNRRKGIGIKDIKTDDQGWLRTPLPAAQKSIDSIICVPLAGYWAAQLEAVPVVAEGESHAKLSLVPVAKEHKDGLERMLTAAAAEHGKGVKIGIVDAGVSRAEGLNIVNGLNTTGPEPADEWFDSGSGHGTHVAGIVSRIAPAAEIYAYRVFEKGAAGASEFAIARAVRQAVEDGCDLINLSLGQSTEPISISRETRRARAFGAVCIAATGNDYMSPVCYPARSGVVVAVTAAGVLDSWPEGAMTASNIADRPEPVGDAFFARFSNVGPEVDFIGPGVGIISWVSEKEKGVMDGTSMACPAVTGLFARLLSQRPEILKADRDQQRSDDIIRMANASAKPIGFGRDYEGAGLIN